MHPNRVRHYARASGLLAKTDKIDSKLIADFASHFNIKPQVNFKSQNQRELTCLIKRRDQLMVMENQEYSRLETEKDNVVVTSIRGHINYLQQEIKAIE